MKQSANISNTIFSKTQICSFQKCIGSTSFSILAKIKSPVMVPKPSTRTWFHRQMSGYKGFPNSVKACVHYFLSNLIFSPNDSHLKTMKNVFYFI